jgi:hypothetical protein
MASRRSTQGRAENNCEIGMDSAWDYTPLYNGTDGYARGNRLPSCEDAFSLLRWHFVLRTLSLRNHHFCFSDCSLEGTVHFVSNR